MLAGGFIWMYRVVFLNVCENTDRNYREETQDSLNTQKLHLLFSFLLCIHKTNIRSARYSPSFHSRTPTLIIVFIFILAVGSIKPDPTNT